jgi:hypothetical protein
VDNKGRWTGIVLKQHDHAPPVPGLVTYDFGPWPASRRVQLQRDLDRAGIRYRVQEEKLLVESRFEEAVDLFLDL